MTGNSARANDESLEAFLQGETRPGFRSGRKFQRVGENLSSCFPGQGSNGLAWGGGCWSRKQFFARSWNAATGRCDRTGIGRCSPNLTATDAAQSRLNEVDVIQPALFAIQVALAALWRSWGIEPQAVVGHSLGEVAAAYVAGALSLDDAVAGHLSSQPAGQAHFGQGAMAAVELSIEDARRALAGYEDRVSIAASNGPTSTVLSGDPAALAAILDQLQASRHLLSHGESRFCFA